MQSADETTELWRHPICNIFCCLDFYWCKIKLSTKAVVTLSSYFRAECPCYKKTLYFFVEFKKVFTAALCIFYLTDLADASFDAAPRCSLHVTEIWPAPQPRTRPRPTRPQAVSSWSSIPNVGFRAEKDTGESDSV